MTNFIPIFPLGIVVYPGENLNLHIFEPRYVQLINDCTKDKKPFGIPSVINNKVQDYGTMVEVSEIVNGKDEKVIEAGLKAAGGDIKTKGIRIFRILEIIKEVPDKLYSGAIVNYPGNDENGSAELMRKIMAGIRELHQLLKVSKDFKKEDEALSVYEVAHHLGLSLQEEYDILLLLKEKQRQEYLKRHLKKVITIVAEMEALKEKIKLNGHFKNISGFQFEI